MNAQVMARTVVAWTVYRLLPWGLAMVIAGGWGHAVTFNVNTTIDEPATPAAILAGECLDTAGSCSLRAAVQVADRAPSASTIVLPAGIYELTRSGIDETPSSATSPTATVVNVPDPSQGDLNLTQSMSIVGAGATQTVIEWDPNLPDAQRDRIFHIEATTSNVTVELKGLTVQGGYVPPPRILTVMSPTAVVEFMRFGGGIASGPAASVQTVNPQLTHGQGSEGHGESGSGAGSGDTAVGVDQVSLVDVDVLSNTAGSDGGGIYSAAPLTLENSLISANTAGANGGGLYNDAALGVIRTTIGNTSLNPSGNRASNGGGLFDTGFHSTIIQQSAIVGNAATGGGGIAGRRLVEEYITNTTIADNVAQDTGGGITTNGRVVLTNDTIADNRIASDTEGGGAGLNGFGPASGSSTGSGASGANYTLVNTVLSNNTVEGSPSTLANCGGTGNGLVSNRFHSLGHNLEDADTCGFSANGDLTDTNPLLKPLGDYGGDTQTMALESMLLRPADGATSPAIDAGDNNHCPNNDQRGALRPADGTLNGQFICDIGAYELFVPSADLHVNDMEAPNTAFAGEPFNIVTEVHVDPQATGSALGVQMTTDPLPTDLSVNSATVTIPSGAVPCTQISTGAVTCLVGTLQPDEVATMNLNVTATQPEASPLLVTVRVTSSQPIDPDLSNNTATVRTEVLGLSDLNVALSGPDAPVNVGSAIDIPFSVNNLGPNEAGPVTLGIAIPEAVTYQSVAVSGGSCDASDPTAILCTIPTLAVGESATGLLTVVGKTEGEAQVQVGAYAPQRDDNPLNDTAAASLVVRGLSDLAVSGGFTTLTATSGQTVELAVQAANKGPTAATNTMLSVELPSGLSPPSSMAGSNCVSTNQTLNCSVGTLNVGERKSLVLQLKVGDVSGSLATRIELSSDKLDPNLQNNDLTASIAVSSPSGGGGSLAPESLLALLALVILVIGKRMIDARSSSPGRPSRKG